MGAVIFDEIVGRHNTGCRKWDSVGEVFGSRDVLPLWIADMDFAAPPAVVKAIQDRARHPVYGYHTCGESVYQAVMEWLRRRHGWEVQREWVLNAPGVVSSISLCILAYTDPGDQIIIQPPVYPPFFACIKRNGRQIVENPLCASNGRYEMDFDDLKRKMNPRVKMLVLCSPHNPVGRVWTREELERLGEICLQHKVIILSDEIHSDLVFPGNKHIPVASLDPEIAKNTITCIAPSKTFNIPGLYASFAVIADTENRRKFHAWQEAVGMGEGNLFGILAAEAAYKEGAGWLEELLPYLESNAAFLIRYITERIPAIKVTKPEGTYLGWLDCRGLFPKSADLKAFLVNKAKVGLNDGLTFGRQGEGFARINFGCPRVLLKEGLQRIEKAVNSL